MQIVATFAHRRGDGKEYLRTEVFKVEVRGSFSTYLHEAVAIACTHCRHGERVVRIIEGGYQ